MPSIASPDNARHAFLAEADRLLFAVDRPGSTDWAKAVPGAAATSAAAKAIILQPTNQ